MDRLRHQSERTDPLAGLSDQERRVLELIGEGLTNRQIGERMFVAPETVKTHLARIYGKLGVHSRAELTAQAVRQQAWS